MTQTLPREPAAHPAPAGGGAKLMRIAALIVLLGFIGLAIYLLMFTQHGNQLIKNPRQLRGDVTQFVSRHPLTAPLAYISVYALLGTLALPVWWLQILGGCAFGLPIGVLYSQIAAVISAVGSARFSHWLAADWFHRIEDRLVRLKKLDEVFGHNGLLVVMAVRLMHVIPFGISNYCFGLTTVNSHDIAWGTFLGGIPAVAVYVAIGTRHRPLQDWRFLLGLAVIHALLVIPLIVHYFGTKPATDSK